MLPKTTGIFDFRPGGRKKTPDHRTQKPPERRFSGGNHRKAFPWFPWFPRERKYPVTWRTPQNLGITSFSKKRCAGQNLGITRKPGDHQKEVCRVKPGDHFQNLGITSTRVPKQSFQFFYNRGITRCIFGARLNARLNGSTWGSIQTWGSPKRCAG